MNKKLLKIIKHNGLNDCVFKIINIIHFVSVCIMKSRITNIKKKCDIVT
jgi:hypothetical protein